MSQKAYTWIMKGRTNKYLEYKILIMSDVRTGTGHFCYSALVPVLGIAADGDTIEEAFKNARTLIEFHLEALRKEGRSIPTEDPSKEFITTARVAVPI